jgi:hypothetical protein
MIRQAEKLMNLTTQLKFQALQFKTICNILTQYSENKELCKLLIKGGILPLEKLKYVQSIYRQIEATLKDVF